MDITSVAWATPSSRQLFADEHSESTLHPMSVRCLHSCVTILTHISLFKLLMPLRASVLFTAIFQRVKLTIVWDCEWTEQSSLLGTLDSLGCQFSTLRKMVCSKNGRAPWSMGDMYHTRVCIHVVTRDAYLTCWCLTEPHWKNTQEAKIPVTYFCGRKLDFWDWGVKKMSPKDQEYILTLREKQRGPWKLQDPERTV